VPSSVVAELTSAAGSPRGGKLAEQLARAARAHDRERYGEALAILRKLADEVPGSPAVRELHGLTLYRMGRWRAAIKELEAYRALSGSYDQHPVLADSYRALGNRRAVEDLWDELRRASPSADVVAEGRIVTAGSRADEGNMAGAIALLENAKRPSGRPGTHHVRQWYALADLLERAGDVPRARDLFRRVAEAGSESYDAAERASALE
jgi:tetratricopeptide (TPR) repeat protein